MHIVNSWIYCSGFLWSPGKILNKSLQTNTVITNSDDYKEFTDKENGFLVL